MAEDRLADIREQTKDIDENGSAATLFGIRKDAHPEIGILQVGIKNQE